LSASEERTVQNCPARDFSSVAAVEGKLLKEIVDFRLPREAEGTRANMPPW